MDSVTQMALGAAIAEAGFRRRLGGKAVAVGAACGLAPDLDLLLTLGDPLASLVVHRGSSHSLLVLPWVALALGGLSRMWAGGRGRYVDWVHLCFWTLITHPLLDLFTSYGTQLFAPFDRTRFALDGVAVIDPLYSLPLFAVVVLALRADRSRARRVSVAMLLATSAYLGLGYGMSQRALAMARPHLQRAGFDPVQLRAIPTLLNILVFRIVARDAAGHLRIGHASIPTGRVTSFVSLSWPAAEPWATELKASELGRTFFWFADGFVHAEAEDEPANGALRVTLGNQKFGLVARPTQPVVGLELRLDPRSHEVLGLAHLTPSATDVDVGTELARLWQLVTQRSL